MSHKMSFELVNINEYISSLPTIPSGAEGSSASDIVDACSYVSNCGVQYLERLSSQIDF
jgi:hypothetical protein